MAKPHLKVLRVSGTKAQQSFRSMYSRRIDETRRVRRKRTRNRKLNGQLAQSLYRTINHTTDQSKPDHHRSRSSGRKSRSRANEQSSTDRASNCNHLQVATFESLRELIGLLYIGTVRVTVGGDLSRRFHVGKSRSRFEGVDEASKAFTSGGPAILGASVVSGRSCWDVFDGIAHLWIVHRGEWVGEGNTRVLLDA